MSHAIHLLLVLGTVIGCQVIGSGADLTAEELALRQESTVQKITTLKLNYKQVIHGLEAEDFIRIGKYMRRNSVVFIEEVAGDSKAKRVQSNIRRDGQTLRSLQQSNRAGQATFYQADIYRADGVIGTTDLYYPLLLQACHPSESRMMTYRDFYAKCTTSVHHVQHEGRWCYRVDAEFELGGEKTLESYWHDPDHGYLVTKMTKTESGLFTKPYQTIELSGWLEQSGNHFPSRMLLTNSPRGKTEYTHTITCESVEVNVKIDERALELPKIPQTAFCYDHVRMKQFQMDSNWKSIGAEKEFVVQRFESKKAGVETAQPFDLQPTTTEGWPLWIWVMSVSAVVLLATLGLRYFKARKAE